MYGGHQQARKLAQAGINTTAIADSAIFAMMARVNKVCHALNSQHEPGDFRLDILSGLLVFVCEDVLLWQMCCWTLSSGRSPIAWHTSPAKRFPPACSMSGSSQAWIISCTSLC